MTQPSTPLTIPQWIRKRLGEQTTHSAIVLGVIMLLAARAAGIDLVEVTETTGRLLVALATASVAAKALLPEAPPPPPPQLSEAAADKLERIVDATPTVEVPRQ